ncbi:MAG TPA: helix-turn-helix transcriptional regulator, partial [Rhizomicrobium sp.]
ASFGEWPTPALEHTDSKCIGEFVASLEAEGHADALKAARRSISSWMDPKLTLRSLRLEAGLSQDQLAALMETSQPQIARMESGKQDMQLSTLKRLATVLEIELHKVVDACG